MKRLLIGLMACAGAPILLAQAPQNPPPAPSSGPQPAQQQPVFRATVDLLRVDVQVVGNDGQPVPTLTLPDFEVFIDGRPRRVVSTELVRYSPAILSEGAAVVPIRTPGRIPEDGRVYVIAVDQAAFSTGAVMPIRRALQQFINQLRPEDMVALYDFPFRQPLLDLTHDHAAVARAFNRIVGLFEPSLGVFSLSPSEIIGITAGDSEVAQRVVSRECDPNDISCPSAVRQEATAVAGFMEADSQMRLAALSNLMRGLSYIQGRKTVLLVSGGMLSSTRTGGRPDVTTLMGKVGSEAAAADANLYVLHWDNTFFDAYSAANRPTRRPSDRFETMFEDRHATSQGLEVIAGKAGGAFLRIEAGTGESAFNRVLRETAAYYLLGVEPGEAERDGKAHFLRVSVKPSGVTVRVRSQVVIPRRISGSTP
jgi:VWFA-related protein